MDVQVGAVDLLADARQARQHRHADPDGGDRVAVALEHPHPARCAARGSSPANRTSPTIIHCACWRASIGFDAVDHHDPHARQHGDRAGTGRDRRTAARSGSPDAPPGTAPGTAPRSSARRWRRCLSVRFVDAPRRAFADLDEDRREAGDHEQRRRDKAQQLAISSAEHQSERIHRPRRCAPALPLPFGAGRAAGGGVWSARPRMSGSLPTAMDERPALAVAGDVDALLRSPGC